MIIVFARAPVPGAVKTRLVPRLGEWRAAQLHARLTRQAVRIALAARCGPVELHGTARHSFFSSLKVPFRLQRGRDLGERMYHALSQATRPAILIGADCPMLTPADLRRAERWLRGGCDAVLAPAEDGGYALIAMRRPRPELFRDIDWGGPRVYAETVKKLTGYRWRALRRVWDVDRPEDLERLRSLRWSSASRRGAPRSLDTRARWDGSGRP
ncbi:MAG TPA: TIGR04282 family arsenosugar biosynthesis glycosyltransferase [Burkholderiales bacterium]|nr:TIGR04282 family arsenosugar biosynthesis glycosyltransferase [Burkholderiales bacterium]